MQLTTYGETDLATGAAHASPYASGAQYSYYAWNASGNLERVALANNHQSSWGYQLYIKAGTDITTEQINGLHGTTITLAIDNSNSSRIVGWVSTTTIADNAVPGANTSQANIALPDIVASNGKTTKQAVPGAFVGMYADGGTNSQNDGTASSLRVVLAVTIS